ncbi:molybdenum ABC transporter ATP-binding protein [Marinospirillum alkaliphilum]|uniref:Molybdate transport system ATP-binding protein n=1 Tax=Marinospirillum alkaliphilum DSM 21637 TaxID=1122209 RepID=A0A1K1YI87_9GAMM|nr:molybdenum ABC transporter ATP-binding protein [Marinospirillum alkaliphilum]SFX61107.1 molybdate transport system ATP-binding protein [Marinospirillum alkaliphilum DSM 21637]
MIQADFQLQRGNFSLDVALRLPSSGVTALFGRSGSGKTTLLRCMAGLEYQPGGRMVFQGEVWQNSKGFRPVHQRPLGYVFQEASLFPHLRVINNLLYGYQRIPATQQQLQPDQVIELLGISELLQRYPDQLSGGQRQRVAIGRALLTSPQLLLMDEPMASLDATSKAEILPFLERLRDELDIPIVYVSHAIEEVTRLADHLVLLDHGQVVAQGDLQQLLTDPNLPFSQSETASSVLQARVVNADVGDGLSELQLEHQSMLISRCGLQKGQATRVRILARDVVLALTPPDDISLLNCLETQVLDIQPDAGLNPNPSQVLVRLQLGQQTLLARISKRSAERMALKENQGVYALIKGVAVA